MIERWSALVARIRPFSTAALLVAVCSVAVAGVLRLFLGWLGIHTSYLVFFPAVVIASLLAGAPAGLGVMAAGALIGTWTFRRPIVDFPGFDERIAAAAVFVFAASCVIVIAHLYRKIVDTLRQREEERELLLKELEHRGRNTYAIVESIVRRTLEHDPQHADAIAGRVRAVSASNDLINWSHTKTIKLQTLLLLQFQPVHQEQLQLSGPDVELSPTATRNLALVFHELLTNAQKYGALSNAAGRISVKWEFADGSVRLIWKEEGGPPVTAPTHKGFGTEVIERTLQSLSGNASATYPVEGLSYLLTFKV